MVVFPPAKINLGLNVVSKRPDGYHNIETVLYPIPLSDVLEIVPSDKFSFDLTGDIEVEGKPDDNLCVRAWRLLKDAYDLPPVSIHLHKIVPTGAGLGGGSSYAAFTLRTINSLFSLDLDNNELQKYAARLGADCPFFIENVPALATGTGTDLAPCPADLSGHFLALVKPPCHISTQAAYQGVKPGPTEVPVADVVKRPMGEWKDLLHNDFENSIFPLYPELAKAKERMYEMGAVYAAMSGSGSTVFGIFEQEPEDQRGLNEEWVYQAGL